jgi:hypothetical protein
MRKMCLFLLVFSFWNVAHAERCGCGEKKEGLTIEYSVYGSGQGGSKCCEPGLVVVSSAQPAISMTWRDNGNGTYTMTGVTQYEDPNQAQKDCCPDDAA